MWLELTNCQKVLEDFGADSNWFIGLGSWSPTQQSTGSPGAKKPSKTSAAEVVRSSTGKEAFEKDNRLHSDFLPFS